MTQPISPSITAEWLLCPTYGRLNRQWTPFSHWTPYFAMGHAIHTAIELILGGKEIGQAVLGAITRLSMEYEEQDEWPLDTLEALLKKGISAMMSKSGGLTQIMANEKVIGTEVKLGRLDAVPGEWDDATADLITERGSDFIITDHKNSLKLDARYIQRNLAESEVDWQLWDYAIRAQQKYGRLVTHTRRHLIIFSPTAKSILHETRLNQEALQAWYRGAQTEWDYIHNLKDKPLEELPMRITSCTTKFGRCRFYAACHTANRDPEKMSMLYKPRDESL